jgi:alpha-amylase/alpha-mannosidase (GH57 family)
MELQFNIAKASAILNPVAAAHSSLDATLDTKAEIQGVYVTLHGHFYQPPRENPYLDAIERQPSAAPFHNWNERIYHECYRPNAFARILNEAGEVVEVVNNFEYLSFNIGPTLMRWLEQHDDQVYQRILEADRKSCDRLDGHGNAIAQVYNHIIMPLANRRDKVTQVRWGIADFQTRFGRAPEGMWLAEAAVDYATLEVLIEEGIKFIVLAPSQLQRCRPTAPENDPEGLDYPWENVGGCQIDPTRPYRCFLPEGDRSRDYIDVFVYDGPISRDIGFEDAILSSSEQFANRIAQAVRPDRESAQLIAIATDGETFGHHKRNTEKALAYGFRYVMPEKGWTITNFAHYLSLHSPTWEVEIKSITAWSCAHGVGRWQDDCGCGSEGGWHQKWRRPLRDALDWLRDRLSEIYVEFGDRLFLDPWAARDDYASVLLRKPDEIDAARTALLQRYQRYALTETEQVDALRLLEMQRHTLLMYTSCGWFFEELSRPEGVQILRYAARALTLACEVSGVALEAEFLERLALAPSNVEQFKTGAEVYRQLVLPSQVTLHQVVAHYAMSSLFDAYPIDAQLYSYSTHQWDYETHHMGKLTLAMSHLQLTATATREATQVVFAVLHMGGWDFHCVVQPFTGRPHYTALKQALFEQLQQASTPRLVLAMNQYFGDRHYGIEDLFAEDRQRLLETLSQETLARIDQLYTQVYRDNYSLLMAYRQDDLEGPQELLMAAQVALSHRATQMVQGLGSIMTEATANPWVQLNELEAIATEAEHLGCQLTLGNTAQRLDFLLQNWLTKVLCSDDLPLLQSFIQCLSTARRLRLPIQEDRLQERYIHFLQEKWVPSGLDSAGKFEQHAGPLEKAFPDTRPYIKLGQTLAIDMRSWLALFQLKTGLDPILQG